MEHPLDKEIQVCSNKVPPYLLKVLHINIYIYIYREMLKHVFLFKNCFTKWDSM